MARPGASGRKKRWPRWHAAQAQLVSSQGGANPLPSTPGGHGKTASCSPTPRRGGQPENTATPRKAWSFMKASEKCMEPVCCPGKLYAGITAASWCTNKSGHQPPTPMRTQADTVGCAHTPGACKGKRQISMQWWSVAGTQQRGSNSRSKLVSSSHQQTM